MKDFSTYKRGQVWYISDDTITRGSIQSTSRPYVVVSNDLCNTYSSVIHLAPITSKPKKEQPTHVTFTNPEGETNTILLEQVTIKSVPAINRKARYMFTLSDPIMSKVDRALQVQFGLPQHEESYTVETVTLSSERIDYLMHSDAHLEVEASYDTNIDDEHEEDTPKRESQIDKFNARFQKYQELNADTRVDEPEEVPIDRTKSGRIRWTDDLKRYFLYEAINKSEDDMMDKYNLSRQTYRTTLSKIRREAQNYNNEHNNVAN